MSLKQIGALWRKDGKNGSYLAGRLDLGVLGQVSIAVFQNEKGEGDENRPDASICMFENEKPQE